VWDWEGREVGNVCVSFFLVFEDMWMCCEVFDVAPDLYGVEGSRFSLGVFAVQ
jgi:hypothetical protein